MVKIFGSHTREATHPCYIQNDDYIFEVYYKGTALYTVKVYKFEKNNLVFHLFFNIELKPLATSV